MPKVKSRGGAKKRFSVTGTGKIKREKAFRSHILTSKSRKRKRRLRASTLVAESDQKRIMKLMHI
jgi:large subunit ribosomal protein L35